MKPGAEIITLDARHRRCWALLPWAVNGTLSGEEREAVHTHLRQCRRCRQERERLQLLAEAVRAPVSDIECEDALQRLHARLDGGARGRVALPWHAVALLVLMCGLGGQILDNAERSMAWLRNTGVSMMRQTHAESGLSQPVTAHLVFFDDLTAAELRQLLLSFDAEVVEGPTTGGVYTVALRGIRSWQTAARVLSELRQARGVVYAELNAPTSVSGLIDW